MSRHDLEQHQANQEHHFRKRARRRLRLEVSQKDYAQLVAKIKENKPGVVFLRHGRPGSTVWRIRWRHRYIVAVFDHKTDRIVTTWRWKG